MTSFDSLSEPFKTWHLMASQRFDMPVLVDELEYLKKQEGGKPFISRRELKLLVAAACEIPLEEVSHALNLQLKSLTVENSKTLGSYLKKLLSIKEGKRLYWHNIAQLLEKAGYGKYTPKEIEDEFERDSQIPPIPASVMIEDISKKILELKTNSSISPASLSPNTIQQLISKGDSESSQGNYRAALEFYLLATQVDPLNSDGVVKIALCLKRLNAYKDAVEMAQYGLEIIQENKKARASLYQVLARSFEPIVLKQLNDGLLRQTLLFYTEAFLLSSRTNCLAAWNTVALLLEFAKRKKDSESKYLSRVQSWYLDFKSAATNPESNFKDYSVDIFKDRNKILEWLEDPGLRDQLSNLENLLL